VEYRGLGDIVGTWSILTNISAQVAATPVEVVDSLDSTNRCYRIRTP
jgi:hypothetical protein